MSLSFPKVADVAWELRCISKSLDGEAVVSFQILDDGNWWVHIGDQHQDLSMHGYSVAITLPGKDTHHHKPRRFNSEELARFVIDTASDKYIREKNGY